jgi:hypothetical protein
VSHIHKLFVTHTHTQLQVAPSRATSRRTATSQRTPVTPKVESMDVELTLAGNIMVNGSDSETTLQKPDIQRPNTLPFNG